MEKTFPGKSIHTEREMVKFDYPTLREEREGWGTRRLVAGTELKSAFIPPSTCAIDKP